MRACCNASCDSTSPKNTHPPTNAAAAASKKCGVAGCSKCVKTTGICLKCSRGYVLTADGICGELGGFWSCVLLG